MAGNEAGNIGRCVNSVAGVADEVVLVDTGATDGTFRIAEGICMRADLTYQIIRDNWDDDFARSRNAGLEAARCDWLMWVDADEEIPAEALTDNEARDGLLTLKNDPPECAFQFITRNVGRCDYSIVEMERFYRMRMWPREADVRYTGRVHEQINTAIVDCGLEIYNLPIEIHHHGYASRERLMAHAIRNARIYMQTCYKIPFGFPLLEMREGDYYALAGRGRLTTWKGVKILTEELIPVGFAHHTEMVRQVKQRLWCAIETAESAASQDGDPFAEWSKGNERVFSGSDAISRLERCLA